MNKILISIKEYFADMGIFAGCFFALCFIPLFIVSLPLILIWSFNEASKTWFGGDNDA